MSRKDKLKMTPEELRECLILEAEGKKIKVNLENPNWKHVLIIAIVATAATAIVYMVS